jgi:hypothetical protein
MNYIKLSSAIILTSFFTIHANRLTQDERQAAMLVRASAAVTETIGRPNYNIEGTNNGDEENVPDFAAQYSKLLEHDQDSGILTVNGQKAYMQFVKAMSTGLQADFNAIQFAPDGTLRLLVDPQSGLAWSMQGKDSGLCAMPLPPSITSPQGAADMIETYLLAICRDVNFADYGTGQNSDIDSFNGGSITANAAAILQDLGQAYQGPRNSNGVVDTTVLFRGCSAGDLIGPYFSQFLMQDFLPLFDAGCVGITAHITGIMNLPGLQDPFALNVQSPFRSQQYIPIPKSMPLPIMTRSIHAIQ